jgi:DHA1 family multidrug resistance protein-like MFS transporter
MVVIVAVSACNMLGFAAVFALLPKLQDAHGLSTKSLGLITATSVIMSVITQLSLSRFADRGRSLLLMRTGALCMALGFSWFAVSDHFWQFALARALVGTGGGMFTPAARRTIVSQDPARAGQLIGTMVAVEVGGFVVGPPLALGLYQLGGLRLPFFAPTVLLLIGLPFIRTAASSVTTTRQRPHAVRSVLSMPAARAALVIGGAANLSIGAFEPVIAKQLTDLGSSDRAIALTLSSFAVPYVFLTRYGGRLADRYGAHRTAIISMLCTAPVIAMFGIVRTALLIASFGLLRSIFDTITTPSGSSAMARAVPHELLATGQGLYGATASTMTGVAAALGAFLYGAYGARTLWLASAGSMLALTVLTGVLSERAGVWRPGR